MKSRQILGIFCIIIGLVCAYFVFRPDEAIDPEYPAKVYIFANLIFFYWAFWVITSCFVMISMIRSREASKFWKWSSLVSGGVLIMLALCMEFFVGIYINLALAVWFLIWFVVVILEDKIYRIPARG